MATSGADPIALPVTVPGTPSGRSTVYAPRGVVATSQPLATGAALGVLEAGGTAADAAVTAAAVLNVTEPHMTGIGGDMFAIVWSASEGRLSGVDASGRSGSKTEVQALLDEGAHQVPETGPRSVTVPGALSGWQALLDAHGTISMSEALAPATRLAEEGFPVTPIVARDWGAAVGLLSRNDGADATYLTDGRAPTAGDWVENPDLAESFRMIGRDGIGTMYGGELGRRIVAGLDELGGYLTLDDLGSHEPSWVEPLEVDYGGYTLHELPPAGQGVAALQMLKILERFDVGSMSHGSAEHLHTLIEAKKLAYDDLARYVADSEHMDVQPLSLLDSGYLAERASLIDLRVAASRCDPGRPVADPRRSI